MLVKINFENSVKLVNPQLCQKFTDLESFILKNYKLEKFQLNYQDQEGDELIIDDQPTLDIIYAMAHEQGQKSIKLNLTGDLPSLIRQVEPTFEQREFIQTEIEQKELEAKFDQELEQEIQKENQFVLEQSQKLEEKEEKEEEQFKSVVNEPQVEQIPEELKSTDINSQEEKVQLAEELNQFEKKEKKVKKEKKEKKCHKNKDEEGDLKKAEKKLKQKEKILGAINEMIPEISQRVAQFQQEQNKVVHKGVSCDGCGVCPIVGNRYKCAVTPDFDFCDNCERTKPHPYPFLKIKLPSQAPISILVTMEEDNPPSQKKQFKQFFKQMFDQLFIEKNEKKESKPKHCQDGQNRKKALKIINELKKQGKQIDEELLMDMIINNPDLSREEILENFSQN